MTQAKCNNVVVSVSWIVCQMCTNTDLRDVVVKNGLHVGWVARVDDVEASAV